ALAKVSKQVERRKKKPLKEAEIALKIGKVLGHYKMGKHFLYTMGEGKFQWSRRERTVEEEAKLDGIYVIRTSEPVERLSAADTVRSYKSLAQVERAFRSLKGVDLLIRPFAIAPRIAYRRTFSCACWRTTWSGIYGECGRHCCLRTSSSLRSVAGAIRFCRQPARHRRKKRSSPGRRRTDFPCTVSPL